LTHGVEIDITATYLIGTKYRLTISCITAANACKGLVHRIKIIFKLIIMLSLDLVFLRFAVGPTFVRTGRKGS